GIGGDLNIGPIPKGTPVALISNIQILAESAYAEDKAAHVKKLVPVLATLIKRLKGLHRLAGDNPTDEQARAAFVDLVPALMSISKCPDYIVNKGHYFGSYLADDDKNALIEFIKTF